MIRLTLATAAALVAALGGSSAPVHAATAPTVVSIQFDDGTADQYGALTILNAHGMHATFYVNSSFIGDSAHMSWAQLGDLFAAGNEIGGHTLTHAHLKHLKRPPRATRSATTASRSTTTGSSRPRSRIRSASSTPA